MIFTKQLIINAECCFLSGGGLSTAPNHLSATAFDLCFTAGPWEDVSVGSCRRLISPALTQAQLVDSTLWDFVKKKKKKLSGPRQINHLIPCGLSQAPPTVSCYSLFANFELWRGTDFMTATHSVL